MSEQDQGQPEEAGQEQDVPHVTVQAGLAAATGSVAPGGAADDQDEDEL